MIEYVSRLSRMLTPKEGLVFGPMNNSETRIGAYEKGPLPSGIKQKDILQLKGEDPLEELYRTIQQKGITVKEVSHKYLLGAFQEARNQDAVGFTVGDTIYIARDYRGRPLTSAERRAILYHEVGHVNAGPNESAAQRTGMQIADVSGDAEASALMRQIGIYEGWLN